MNSKKNKSCTTTLNNFKGENEEIFKGLKNYAIKDYEHRHVLVFIEDECGETDTNSISDVGVMAWNPTREFVGKSLRIAALKSSSVCLGLLDAYYVLHRAIREEFPQEYERLLQYDGKTFLIELAKLVKKLTKKMSLD